MKQNCKGYKGYIFTGNPDLAKRIGLKAARKIEFYNGKLDCRLLGIRTIRRQQTRTKTRIDT